MKIFLLLLILAVILIIRPTRRVSLALVSLCALDFAGISLGANLLCASIVGVLGIPGIIAVLALNLIY